MDFISSVTKNFSEDTIRQVASAAGISPETAGKAFSAITPLILSKMSDNATSSAGTLHGALDAHDGSIFADLGALGSQITDGEKILGHVFGQDTQGAVQEVATQTGINTEQVQKVMALIAPLILGALGKAKKEGMDASSLKDTLQGLATLFGSNKNLAEAAGALMQNGASGKIENCAQDILSILNGFFGKK